ncbi:TlpA family protein disulfide reductase [Pedobacter sp. MW01-1-1]|uniref:TlpA family protein disulfide reductase n=1 Tax=Pedobacter sp. MW01-1-1 TaxID=3383027 RepID=UPI003FEF3406
MKQITGAWLLMAFVLFANFKTFAQTDSITVNGTLKNLENNSVSLIFQNSLGKSESYKTTAVKDKFSFKIPKQTIPAVARLNIGIDRTLRGTANGQNFSNPAPLLDLFVYNKNIQITGEATLVHLAFVKGDDENNTFNQFKEATYKDEKFVYETYLQTFNAQYKNVKLNSSIEEIQEASLNARKRITQQQKDFISKHPDALASIFLLNRMTNQYTAAGYTQVWNGLSDKYKNHPAASRIKANIQKFSSTLPGTAAINFIKKDKDGKVIDLSAYKGRTVLLDFWGSWCSPCRASHPHLKTLYSKYKSKGFEIIAVAYERGSTIEESKKSWLKAIDEDKINWVHVLNFDESKRDLVKEYKVDAFPTKILIDKEGKVILRVTASATNDIDKELEKIYGF